MLNAPLNASKIKQDQDHGSQPALSKCKYKCVTLACTH